MSSTTEGGCRGHPNRRSPGKPEHTSAAARVCAAAAPRALQQHTCFHCLQLIKTTRCAQQRLLAAQATPQSAHPLSSAIAKAEDQVPCVCCNACRQEVVDAGIIEDVDPANPLVVLPLSSCPLKCSMHGGCVRRKEEVLPWCVCHYGFTGAANPSCGSLPWACHDEDPTCSRHEAGQWQAVCPYHTADLCKASMGCSRRDLPSDLEPPSSTVCVSWCCAKTACRRVL